MDQYRDKRSGSSLVQIVFLVVVIVFGLHYFGIIISAILDGRSDDGNNIIISTATPFVESIPQTIPEMDPQILMATAVPVVAPTAVVAPAPVPTIDFAQKIQIVNNNLIHAQELVVQCETTVPPVDCTATINNLNNAKAIHEALAEEIRKANGGN